MLVCEKFHKVDVTNCRDDRRFVIGHFAECRNIHLAGGKNASDDEDMKSGRLDIFQ
jgi:hypothetical protein